MARHAFCTALTITLLLKYANHSAFAAGEVDIAPTKDWCKVTGGKEWYALNPDGKCVNCEKSEMATWQIQYSVCPTRFYFPRPYEIIKKGGYKHCVCAAGYWGRPTGLPKGDIIKAKTFVDLGCYCCDPGRSFLIQSPVNATSPFQCNICNPAAASGKAPFCRSKPCPAGAKRNCVDCRCRCQYDPFGSDEGPPDPPCPVPATKTCTIAGQRWDYRAKKCTCYDDVYRSDVGCKCFEKQIPVAAKFDTFKEPKKGGFCSYCDLGEEQIVTEKGKKVCGCKPGFTVSTLARYFGVQPKCQRCNGANVTLDSRGDCTCKKGLAPFIIAYTEDGDAYPGYKLDVEKTCHPCPAPAYKVNDAGVCECAPGYALGYRNQCVLCKGPGYKIQPEPPGSGVTPAGLATCVCDVGYYTKETSKGKFVCLKCPAGSTTKEPLSVWDGRDIYQTCYCKDPLRDVFNNCACKFGYQDKQGRCVKKPTCGTTLSASFWSAAQLPTSWKGGAFPDAVLRAKPASMLEVKLPFNATSLDAWKAAGISESVATGKFAAHFKGCVCRPPTPDSELVAYDPVYSESEFYVVVEKADASITASPPLKTAYVFGDDVPKLTTPVLSVLGGSTRSMRVGQLKAVYVHEVCLELDVKFWVDAPASKGPLLSMYVWTPTNWGEF